jgi:hypothetical protein
MITFGRGCVTGKASGRVKVISRWSISSAQKGSVPTAR